MMNVITVSELRRKNISFLLVTAAEPEKKAVLKVMRPMEGETEFIKAVGENMSYEIGVLGKYSVAHVHCENQGSIKEGAAILTTQEAMSEVKPKACVMIGIAYGADKVEQKIGDVLISEYIQPYDSIRVSTTADGKKYEEDRNQIKEPGRAIKNQFVSFDFNNKNYNIWHGTLLSGEKLIDNEKYKEELIERFSVCKGSNKKIIGGEMEGVGLASALSRCGNANWIIVKAICDWADGNKKENKKEKQALAAKNAADFCKRLFMTNMLSQIRGIKAVRVAQNRTALEIINPYVLFYFRNLKMISFRKLSESTKIPEERLRGYEEKGHALLKAPIQDIQKIRNALDCDEMISCEHADKSMIEFYNKYKGNGRFYPVNNAKVVVFDFDGTLTKTPNNYSSWQLIWLHLGYKLEDCGRYHRKYVNKELTHQEWCDVTADQFIRKGLSACHVEEISKKITLVEGTIDTLNIIKERGVKLYICSGAIDDVIDNVFMDNKNFFEDISCNKFTYDKQGRLKSIQGTQYDFEGKAKYIAKIIEENGIQPEECLFVGNSDNDIWAHQSGAKTLVVNPHKITGMNRTEWKYYLEEMVDLHEILPFIFPNDLC